MSSKLIKAMKRPNSPVDSRLRQHDTPERRKKIGATDLRTLRDFETSQKEQKGAMLKDFLVNTGQMDKYRIVTEPVDDRAIAIGINSIGRLSRSKTKFERNSVERNSVARQQINLRSTGSKERQQSASKEQLFGKMRLRTQDHQCEGCQRLSDELKLVRSSIDRLVGGKCRWKRGEISIKDYLRHCSTPVDLGDAWHAIDELGQHIADLMRDIDCLSQIDYSKMLQHSVFEYTPFELQDYSGSTTEKEVMELLATVKATFEGKIRETDLLPLEESPQIFQICRNMKSRLGYVLRENLDLRVQKSYLLKGHQESGQELQRTLKQLIAETIASYG